MILSDWHIKRRTEEGDEQRRIVIDPFSEAVSGNGVISYGLTSAGYDLRLGPDLAFFKPGNLKVDPKRFGDPEYYHEVLYDRLGLVKGQVAVIPPNGFILGHSLEYLRIPDDLKGKCVGKSTYARCGVHVIVTPLEPGWHGHLTIEIANLTSRPAVVYAGEGICQLEFEQLSSRPDVTYADKRGKYQGQQGVTCARVL